MITTSTAAASLAPDVVASDTFRAVCGSFVTGVTVVTASSASGANGSTVNSFTSLTASPPQIIVCLAKTSTTLEHVLASGTFTVNILGAHQEDVARVFASKRSDKLDAVDWAAGANGAPTLNGTMATMECALVEAQDQATHVLLVGRVSHATNQPHVAPLVFFRSALTSGSALQITTV